MLLRRPTARAAAGVGCAFTVAAASVVALAPPAGAGSAPSRPARGPGKVVFPTRSAAPQHATTLGIGPAQLTYGGAVDGIGVTTGAPKVYLVFWGSQWGTSTTAADGTVTLTGDAQGVAPRLQQLFRGIGSGSETWSGVMTQYCQGVSSGATSCPSGAANVGYPLGGALAGVWVDRSTAAPSQATDNAIAVEAVNAAGHFGNTTASANRNAQYVVVSPSGTHPGGFNTKLPNTNWCAWHDWNGDTTLNGGAAASPYGDIAFTNLPYVTDAGASCGANYVNAGAAGALDGVTIVGGHEYAETITDQNPLGGWSDSSGAENADKCAWNGTGGQTGAQDVTFTTGTFAMQATWSNADAACRIMRAVVGTDIPPAPPTIGTATAGNARATVSFSAPASNGGSAVTGYTVTATDTATAANGGQTANGPSSPLTVTGLTNGDTYTFTVTASNAAGTGLPSASSNAVTPNPPPGAPTAPTSVTATAAPGRVTTSWSPPADPGTSPVTGYDVYRSSTPAGARTLVSSGSTATTYVDTAVTPGATYYYEVTAVNDAGEGPASAQVAATLPTVPGAPRNVTATPGAAQATVSFTAPASTGGSAITGYTVTAADTTTAANGHQVVTVASSPATVTGLTNGDVYAFTVAATNGVGTGAASAASNAVTPRTVPSAPTGVTASAGDRSVTLAWAPPASTGGSPVTGYTVYRATTSGGPRVTVGTPTSTGFVDSSAADGTTYYYTVTASNAAGESALSAELPARPHGSPQVAFTGRPAAYSQRTVSFFFAATDPNGEAVTTACRIDGGAPTPCVGGVTYSGLADGLHSVVVSTADADGPGGTAAYAWTVDTTAPKVIQNAPTAPFTLGAVTARWTASDVGGAVASYDVRVRRAAPGHTFGAWLYPAPWQQRTAATVTRAESAGYTDCIAVRARDLAGNVSAWSTPRCTAVVLDDRGLIAGRGWSRVTGRAFHDRTATTTSRYGAVLTRTGVVADRLALVATRCQTCGTVQILIRGHLVATVRLHAASTTRRAVIVLPRFGVRGGRVTVRVVSTGRPVQIDGLGVTRA